MSNEFDHVLLIGFGGPERREEVWPFLLEVTRGRRIPEKRLREVERHYEQTGGFSPYNQHALRFFAALTARLEGAGCALPLFIGMRCWHPFLKETLVRIRQRGLKRGLAVILAPHRAEASFERYVRSLEEAKAQAGAQELEYETLAPWHTHPLFIQAQAEQVRACLEGMAPGQREGLHLLFTAHSIPEGMAKDSGYRQEFYLSSEAVARELGISDWSTAYQSRSGSPQDPWLEPDVVEAIGTAKARGKRGVLVVPIGFLFDHVEVLFDLDIEAKAAAQAAGLRWARVSTVMDHPKFVEMFTSLICEKTEFSQEMKGV